MHIRLSLLIDVSESHKSISHSSKIPTKKILNRAIKMTFHIKILITSQLSSRFSRN